MSADAVLLCFQQPTACSRKLRRPQQRLANQPSQPEEARLAAGGSIRRGSSSLLCASPSACKKPQKQALGEADTLVQNPDSLTTMFAVVLEARETRRPHSYSYKQDLANAAERWVWCAVWSGGGRASSGCRPPIGRAGRELLDRYASSASGVTCEPASSKQPLPDWPIGCSLRVELRNKQLLAPFFFSFSFFLLLCFHPPDRSLTLPFVDSILQSPFRVASDGRRVAPSACLDGQLLSDKNAFC